MFSVRHSFVDDLRNKGGKKREGKKGNKHDHAKEGMEGVDNFMRS